MLSPREVGAVEVVLDENWHLRVQGFPLQAEEFLADRPLDAFARRDKRYLFVVDINPTVKRNGRDYRKAAPI